MKKPCDYHPASPAHWYCEKCETALCPECVETRDMGGYQKGKKLHFCPNCNVQVQWLGVQNIIDPFWKRLPQFFLYPFTARPLMLMVGLAFAAGMAPRLGFLGIFLTLAVWGVAFKYAYAVLQATARGDLTAPKLGGPTLSENFGPVIKQIGIYFAIFFAFGVMLANLGMIGGVAFLLLALLFLPSMIILLVTTESLLQAINPLMFVTLAKRIGWGYLLMYFFCSILGGAPALLGQHVIQYLPQQLHVFLFTLVKVYYTFITYHLMGYVILQYHREIGYAVDFEDFKDERTEKELARSAAEDPATRLRRRINQLVKNGDHQGALAAIERETGAGGITDPLLSERYFALLKMTGARERLLLHGRNHLSLLVRAGRKTEAVDAYLECLSTDSAFTPAAGVLFRIGGWLNENGRSKEAVVALSRLTKAYPRDALVPKAYYRIAQILNDRLMNPQKARQILKALIKRYPGHDIIPLVERYLGQMG